ncbi:3-keto-disaccharide hydrolase [Georgenia sp. MJ170]|uniref:3-keto-disaccharide hydrolase n=1 Tax=Georgenia sunbinii TaxID=3117728 RepID=UPI002F26449D
MSALACAALLSLGATAIVAAPAAAEVDEEGYTVLFDGTQESFENWEYAGVGGFQLEDDGSVSSIAGAQGGFGTLWYPEEFGDFSLKLEFRDDAPGDANVRGNSGVQVRFPALDELVDGCNTNDLAWMAVTCGHEIQINDSAEAAGNDPRKTGSIYGFADIGLDEANATAKGEWNEFEVRVVGQQYTVIRNGVVINEFENVPGLPFPGRPDDPGSSARGPVGHIGLQAHGANQDVVSFRDVRIKELPRSAGDVDVHVDIDELEGPGHLALSVDGSTMLLAEDGSDPLVRQFAGGLPTVTVTDTRSVEEIPDGTAWYVLGSATAFLGSDGETSIGVDHLGWVPELVEAGESGLVTAGDPVVSVVDAPQSPGLVDQELLGTSASADVVEEGEWSADAELLLRTPSTVAPGSYTSTLTLSLFE